MLFLDVFTKRLEFRAGKLKETRRGKLAFELLIKGPFYQHGGRR